MPRTRVSRWVARRKPMALLKLVSLSVHETLADSYRRGGKVRMAQVRRALGQGGLDRCAPGMDGSRAARTCCCSYHPAEASRSWPPQSA
jgi:hypothetical protein